MRLWKRNSSRLKSNHQRGYFWRNRIRSSGGRTRRPVPPTATVVVPAPLETLVLPPIAASTMKIGMAVKIRKKVVSRLRLRSGYSTSYWSGYVVGGGGGWLMRPPVDSAESAL